MIAWDVEMVNTVWILVQLVGLASLNLTPDEVKFLTRLSSAGVSTRYPEELSKALDDYCEFEREHGARFSDVQVRRVRQTWDSYFGNIQCKARDGRIWFALTLEALRNGGAEPLWRAASPAA